MRLTYIWHDCFLLSFISCNIVTDFFRTPPADPDAEAEGGDLPVKSAAEASGAESEGGDLPAFLRELDREKPLYVVVSHHHKDHFTPDIFLWEKHFPRIRYIISRDTARYARRYIRPESAYKGEKKLSRPETVTALMAGEEYSDNCLTVKAFGSTDIGCSYAICCEGLRIFFAGDLNAWVWRREDTAQSDKQMMGEYLHHLGEIAREFPSFDLVLFPVDYRIGESYSEGPLMFVERIRTRCFVPMHLELWATASDRHLLHTKAVDLFFSASHEPASTTQVTSPLSTKLQSDTSSQTFRYVPLLQPGASIDIQPLSES